MLQVMQDLDPKQRKYLITSDESWIFWKNHHRGMWTEDREEVPPNVKRMICSKTTMLSAYFSRTGFVSIEFLPQGQNNNSHFFTEIILPSIVDNLSVARPKLKAPAAHLHINIAIPHNSRLSLQKIEEYGLIRVPQPPYSPDLAPCDFFLLGHLKSQLEGKIFFDENSLKTELERILRDIPITPLCSVMEDWVRRLNQCIESAGNYVS
jgi:histone-lysine N-methyltransferase SETMAR